MTQVQLQQLQKQLWNIGKRPLNPMPIF